jgi:hypothetical protein
MAGERPYSMQVAEAIEARKVAVENDELPRLKEEFRVFHASYQGLHQLLVRKGLVKEDPYKADQKVTELVLPPDDQYIESEREVVIGIRLDAFDNLLEFLNNYFEFRVDSLSFRELKRLTDVSHYIRWDSLTSQSPKATTRGVADLLGRARGNGTDSFASSIVSDSLEQLGQKTRMIRDLIKAITSLKREEYKLELRERLLPALDAPESLDPDSQSTMDALRKTAKSSGLPPPFVPELAAEMLREEFGPDAESLRQQALERLSVKKQATVKKRPQESGKDLLIAAIRSLAAASRQLDVIVERLKLNQEVVTNRSRSFGQRFRDWIDRLTNRTPPKVTYTVYHEDENTGARNSEQIIFADFLEKTARKAKLYASFLARTGTPWARLQQAGEEQLQGYLDRELAELHAIHRRAGALDTHLKEQVAQTERKQMKGIKIELSAVRNAIVATNQAKHEYAAKADEREQLRKLGVDDD